MGSTDPVHLTHLFAADPAPTGLVDCPALDAQLQLIVTAHEAHNALWRSILRGDLTLKDQLIRARMLHPEVVSLLQLVAQATKAGLKLLPGARVASTANLALTGTQTIDGVACIAGDVVLAKDQTNPAENGLWTVGAGAWARTVGADTWDALRQGFGWVDTGTVNGLSGWATALAAGGTLGVDPVALRLVYRAAPVLALLDPSLLATTAPGLGDSVLIGQGSALRRALISALPFLPATTTHGDLVGLGADDHPQYLLRAGDTLTGTLNAAGQRIANVPLVPVDPNDAVSEAFVDARIAATVGRRPGDIFIHAGATPPIDSFVCNGDAVSRTDEAALFAIIGTTFGTGDGSTTFNVPDARGRTIIAAGTGAGLTARALGATGGEETHVLGVNELPAHHHSGAIRSVPGTGATAGSGSYSTQNTGDTGSNVAHNNMQPFIAFLVCIQR